MKLIKTSDLYQKGELKSASYDENGKVIAEDVQCLFSGRL